jgi:hypothetical protein
VSRSVAEIKAQLGAEFPNWRFMRTDRARWWAFREAVRPLPRELMGKPDVLDADTPEDLRKALHGLDSPDAPSGAPRV